MTRTAPNEIKNLRTRAGLSQRDLAERINHLAQQAGVRTTAAVGDTVSRWERGTSTPLPVYRRLLADVLGTTVDALRRANGIRGSYIRAGQTLTIPSNG